MYEDPATFSPPPLPSWWEQLWQHEPDTPFSPYKQWNNEPLLTEQDDA